MSGDGRIVAFESTEDVAGAGGVEAFRAIRANVTLDPPTFVQMGLSRAPAPAISQDGSRIAFVSNADPLGSNADGNYEIFLYDGAKLIQITNTSPGDIANRIADGNFLPSISDDGRFVAFSSNRNLASQNADGSFEIFIFDTVAGGFTQLTNASGIVGFTDAKISGDGTSLAYIRDSGATPSVNRDLLLQNRTGAPSLRTLATNAQELAMTFGRAISDDGKRVVWSAETATNTSQVFLYDGRNNETRQITALSSRVTEVPLHPTLNGNGTRIAFAARRSVSGTGSNADGSVELYTYEIPSSTFGRVTNTTSNDATADVLSSMNDDGTVIAFNFPRALTGVSNEAIANNSEIYVTGTPLRPDFGTLNIVNGASFGHEPATTEAVAPDSVAVAFGTRLANTTQQSQKLPNGTFPTTVGGTTVTVNGQPAQIFFVSPTQVNFLVPPETELGFAEVVVTNPDGFPSRGRVAGLRAAPGIFTYTGDGLGDGVILDANTLQPGPFDPTSGTLRLIIFSTGVRNALQFSVTAGGRALTLESVVRSPDMPGFDEVHVLVPADLRGSGPVDVVIRADTRDSNPVEVTFVGDSSRDIVINEFLSDPPGSGTTDLQGDANHDGTRDTGDDEFVELVNSTTHDINVSGYQLLTRGGAGTSDVVRFTFPSGTILPGCSAIVIFGGGTFSFNDPLFGGAQVFKAPSALSLINSAGVISLRDQSQGIVNLVSYGGSTGLNGNADQSLTRSPDVTGKFTLHQSASGASGASFSPGRRVSGTPFNVCQSVARIDVSPPSATSDEGAHQQLTAQAFDANNQPIPGVIFFWESSNTTVATIDQNGLATGVSPGTTEIRASGRGVQSAPATLTVTPITRILTTIEVTPNPGTVPATATQQFTVRGFDQFGNEMVGLTFTWESTDTNIATVDANGLATGVNQGQTTIKAKSGSVTGTATLNVTAATVIVNEVLADPPDGVPVGDANHDGVRSASDDEFVELVNSTGAAIDISGWTVRTHPTGSTTETIRHTFAASTNLPSGAAIVVFGGGGLNFDPANAAFACAQVVKASSGGLSLTNSGLTVVVRNGSGSVFTQFSYGGSTGLPGDNDQSLTRSPDISGSFVQHLAASGAEGRRFSPGTRVNGTPFGSCPPRLTSITISPSSTTVNVGQSTQFIAQGFDQFGQPMTGTITFASDNTTVATVDSVSTDLGTGVATATVTGQSAGTAHITAQATDGTTTVTSSQATLTVSTPTPVLTSITISPLSATIDIGQTQQFTGQALNQFGQPIGGVTITFASNNLTVATVDTVSPTSGTGSATAIATGHANGSAEIRATADNGAGTTVTSPPATLTVEHFVNASEVLISEFRTRGPGGTSDEFIEIYNPTSSTVPIGELKIIASNGTGGTSTRATITAGATLAPGCHYLIAHTSYTGSVPANQTYGTGITDDGGIAIMRADSTTIIDQVGVSNGSAFKEGTPLTPFSTSVEQSYERKPGGTSGNGTDTNNNASDFFLNAGSSNPQNLASGCLNLNAADLAISKTDSPDPVVTGSNVTYTIVVTNNGIANAQSVVVSDDLPGNVTFVSCGSTGSGVCGGIGNNRTVTFSSLASGASETITLVATANSEGGATMINTATVTSSTTDSNSANNSATATTAVSNPTSADLSISKSDSPDPVAPGRTLTYTLTVTNAGPDAAQSVVVTDNLSSDVTFVDCSSDQGGVCEGSGNNQTIAFSSLASGVTATITIHATVGNSLTTGTVISNTTSVASATADPIPGNNSDSEDATVQEVNAGDIVISEFRFRGSNGANDEFIELYNRTTHAIDISGFKIFRSNNAGTKTLHATITSGVVLQPGCHYLITNSNAGGPYDDGVAGDQTYSTGTADDGGLALTLASGTDSTGILDQVGLSSGSAYKEGTPLASLGTTNVDHGYERKPGGASGNGTDTNNNATDFFLNPTVSNPQNLSSGCLNLNYADLGTTKTDAPDPVVTGSDVTYTIVVTNNGPGLAQSVVVTDNLPSDVTFVSCGSTDSGVCGGSGNNRTVTFSSHASGASETIPLVATANGTGGTTITNTATVSSSTNDPVAANNSAQTTTTVANPPSADLSISKAGSPDPVAPGATLTYTLTVTNGGPDAAQSVGVTDSLSSDVTFVDCSSDQGGVCGGTATSPTISFSSLANGATATMTIHVTVSNSLTTGAVITNTASVSSTTADPASGNNSDSEDTTVQVPTATVTSVDVSPSTATINRGRTQQFSATAFNGVTPVPGATFTWSSSDTNVATIDTNGLATGVGIGTTTITATTSDGIGGTVSGTAMLTVQVPLVINEIYADVAGDNAATTAIEGDSNRDGVRSAAGDEFVELLNNSNASVDLSNVVITDATNAGSFRFTFPSGTILAAGRAVVVFGGGTPDTNDPAFGGALVLASPATLSLNDGGDTVTIELNVGGTDVQIAQVAYGGTGNPPAPIDQSLTRSPDAEVGTSGGSFLAHTSATNAASRVSSPGTRADGTPFGSPAITRIEVLPATAAIDIAATQLFTGHAYSNAGGPEIEVLHVSFIWDSSDPTKATVAPATGQTTTATAIAAGSSTIRARAGGQEGIAALTVNAPTPALTINDVWQVETNGTTTFTFQVSLSSPAPGGGVTFDIATADGTAQDYNPATEDNDYVAQTVTGVTILEGNSTYDFVVAVNGDSVVESDETFLVNVTNVTGATVGDGQGQGTIQNDDSAVVADLGVTKTVDTATPVIGQDVVFTIVLNNLGPDTATGVQVTDVLPSGLSYVSSTVSQGTYDNATGLWTAGSVNNAASATLTITARVQTQGAKTNTATITAFGASDPNSSDNQSSVTFTPGLSQLVISQLYTAGGASSALYNRDFIEIFNRGTVPINLSGFSVQYAATGTGTFTVIASLPNVTLQPRQYFLITAGTTNAAVGASLPVTADSVGTNTNMTGSVGKVAIVFGTTALTSSNVNNPPLTVGNPTPGCPT
ncbi:MAG: lamin tail domain-containing protein, partial [Acidobacteriota bacterium]|nr:lamin tail domain-containing protein [Acidobacteriota bacterium]